jgi:hypothetical protein
MLSPFRARTAITIDDDRNKNQLFVLIGQPPYLERAARRPLDMVRRNRREPAGEIL